MRTIKFIAGLGFLFAALLPGGLALLVFSHLRGPEPLLVYCFASALVVLTISLVRTGWFLIARRDLPMSWKVKVLIALQIFCMGILAVIAAPNFIKARITTAANACVNNLRQIDAAAQEFALENRKTNGENINYPDDLTPYIKLNSQGKIPPCPQGGVYSLKKIGDTPTCSLGTNGNWAHVLP